jgi:hypothetical protein
MALYAVLVAPIPAKANKQQTRGEGGWVFMSGRVQLRETSNTSAAPPAATSRSTFSRQHWPNLDLKNLSILQRRDIHLIDMKYCRKLDCRTSWAPCRNSTKALLHPLRFLRYLPHAPSFWEWVAPSITIAH